MSKQIPPEYFLQHSPEIVECISKIYKRRRSTWWVPVDKLKSPGHNGSGWAKEPISEQDVFDRLNNWAVAVGITPCRVNLFAFDVDPPEEHEGTPKGKEICERRLNNLIEYLGIEPVVRYYSPRGIHAYFRVGDKPPGWLSECGGGDFYVKGEKYGQIRYGVGGFIVVYDLIAFVDDLEGIDSHAEIDYNKLKSLLEHKPAKSTQPSITGLKKPYDGSYVRSMDYDVRKHRLRKALLTMKMATDGNINRRLTKTTSVFALEGASETEFDCLLDVYEEVSTAWDKGIDPKDKFRKAKESARAKALTAYGTNPSENENKIEPKVHVGFGEAKDFGPALRFLGIVSRFNIRSNTDEIKVGDFIERAGGIGGRVVSFDGYVELDGGIASHIKQEIRSEFVRDTIDMKSIGIPWKMSHEDLDDGFYYWHNYHRIDPMLAYFDSIRGTWDDVPRSRQLLATIYNIEAPEGDPIVEMASGLLFNGPIARAKEPGFKIDQVPVFIGPQGVKKELFLKMLLPGGRDAQYFTDQLAFSMDNKQLMEATKGKVYCVFGEMSDRRRTTNERKKMMLTGTNFNAVRGAYERYTTTRPHRFIYIMTSNHDNSLPNDETGNRRYLPVKILGFNEDISFDRYIDEYRDQLWAEELYRYEVLGDRPIMPDGLREIHEARTERYRDRDTYREDIINGTKPEGAAKPGFTMDQLLVLFGFARKTEAIAMSHGYNVNAVGKREREEVKKALINCGWATSSPDKIYTKDDNKQAVRFWTTNEGAPDVSDMRMSLQRQIVNPPVAIRATLKEVK